MKILELFGGSCSFSNVAKNREHKTFTSDNVKFSDIDYKVDILDFDISKIPFIPDVIWASIPCQTFSIASCSTHWTPDKTPKTDKCRNGIAIAKKTLEIINEIQPKFYFIENPRGLLRKMDFMQHLQKTTITYCQYELDIPLNKRRMKPTDIWTNSLDLWTPKKMCKNGMPCHVSAPRGSRTGTQGLKGNFERSKIPNLLCEEILKAIEQ